MPAAVESRKPTKILAAPIVGVAAREPSPDTVEFTLTLEDGSTLTYLVWFDAAGRARPVDFHRVEGGPSRAAIVAAARAYRDRNRPSPSGPLDLSAAAAGAEAFLALLGGLPPRRSPGHPRLRASTARRWLDEYEFVRASTTTTAACFDQLSELGWGGVEAIRSRLRRMRKVLAEQERLDAEARPRRRVGAAPWPDSPGVGDTSRESP
jgi:hypothetical protein